MYDWTEIEKGQGVAALSEIKKKKEVVERRHRASEQRK